MPQTPAPLIAIQRLAHAEGLPLPAYETAGAAGMDLRLAIPATDTLDLAPSARALAPTGFAIALPDGFEAQIRPRSGLAFRHGITCLNSPGTIDCDYRGEIKVLLINLGQDLVRLKRGERIAQMVIAPVAQARWMTAESLDATPRGASGFGSTGTE